MPYLFIQIIFGLLSPWDLHSTGSVLCLPPGKLHPIPTMAISLLVSIIFHILKLRGGEEKLGGNIKYMQHLLFLSHLH